MKPLKWVAKSADEFVAIAVKKVSGLYDGIMGLLKRADNWVDGNWMLPRNVELAVCEGISDFDGFLKVTFKSADDNVAKEALEEGTDKLSKAITAPKNHYDLKAKMGEPPENLLKPQAHHGLPWKHKDWFAKQGVNVNDVEYGAWVEAAKGTGGHPSWSKAYDKEWVWFMDSNKPTVTKEQIDTFYNNLRKNSRWNGGF